MPAERGLLASAARGASQRSIPWKEGEVAAGIRGTGGAEGMVVVADLVDDDVCPSEGDRVAATAPAALRSMTCGSCGFVGAGALISDLQTRDTCGALLPKGPSPLP